MTQKEMKCGVPNPFGHITMEEIVMQTNPEVEEVRCDMVLHMPRH